MNIIKHKNLVNKPLDWLETLENVIYWIHQERYASCFITKHVCYIRYIPVLAELIPFLMIYSGSLFLFFTTWLLTTLFPLHSSHLLISQQSQYGSQEEERENYTSSLLFQSFNGFYCFIHAITFDFHFFFIIFSPKSIPLFYNLLSIVMYFICNQSWQKKLLLIRDNNGLP